MRPISGAPTATPPPSVISGEARRGEHIVMRNIQSRNIGPSDLAAPVLDKNGRKRLFFCGEVFKKRKKDFRIGSHLILNDFHLSNH